MHLLICFFSDTRNISVYHANLNGQWITFLDTPGFDDDALLDADILQDLSFTLAGFHKGNRPLNSIVFLYDISRPRMGAHSQDVYHSLCAAALLKLVTSFRTCTYSSSLLGRPP
jgi:hypothetical protein